MDDDSPREYDGGAIGMQVPGNLVDVDDAINSTTRPIDFIVSRIRTIMSKPENPRVLVVKGKTGSGKTVAMPPEIYMQFGEAPIIVGIPRVKSVTGGYDAVNAIFPQLGKAGAVGFATGLGQRYSRRIDYVSIKILQLQMREAIETFKATNGNMAAVRDKFPYKFIVIDEVHDHSDSTDLTLTAARAMLTLFKGESPFVIPTSATIDVYDFTNYFRIARDLWDYYSVTVLGSSSQQIVKYMPEPTDNWIQQAADVVVNICTRIDPTPSYKNNTPGDIAIFIPTMGRGEKVKRKVDEWLEKTRYPMLVIVASSAQFNNIGSREQRLVEMMDPSISERVFGKPVLRLLIISTDAIEVGVTLPNLTHVIECGFKYSVTYNPRIGCTQKIYAPISQANVTQRMGRVGRNRPGTAYGLYTEETRNKMPNEVLPFTYSDDFSAPLLFLRVLEMDPNELIFPPASEMLFDAEDKLYLLGLVDNDGKPTDLGVKASYIQRLSLESVKMVFAGLAYGISCADLLTMACAVEAKEAEGVPTIIGIDDQFISALMMVERVLYPVETSRYDKKFKFAPESEAKKGETPIWDAGTIRSILDLRREVVKNFARTGISLDNAPSQIQSILFAGDPKSAEYRDLVRGFKRCIYEGYKMNLLVRRSLPAGDYIYTTVRGYIIKDVEKIYGAQDEHYRRMGLSDTDAAAFMIARQLVYSEESGKPLDLRPKCLSILDGYISVDTDMLPQFTTSAEPLSTADYDTYHATLLGREPIADSLIVDEESVCESTNTPVAKSKPDWKRRGGCDCGM